MWEWGPGKRRAVLNLAVCLFRQPARQGLVNRGQCFDRMTDFIHVGVVGCAQGWRAGEHEPGPGKCGCKASRDCGKEEHGNQRTWKQIGEVLSGYFVMG